MNFKHTSALLLTAALGAALLSGCQDTAQTSTSTSSSAATSEAAAAPDTPATSEDATSAASTEASASEAQAAPAVTEPGAIPAGYAEVPPLSSKPVREFKAAPKLDLQGGADYYALIDTSRGQVLVDLLEKDTPVTVNNFVYLARNHFYDGTRFHRVIDGFMAQGGDPKSADESKKDEWGTGGPGYQFPDEIRQNLTFSEPYLLAMANSGEATNGSQFFITLAPTEFLNGRHTIFGRVTEGKDVVDKLTRTSNTDPSTGAETPIEGATPDEVLSVRILTKEGGAAATPSAADASAASTSAATTTP